jgi:hypothetical protein
LKIAYCGYKWNTNYDWIQKLNTLRYRFNCNLTERFY